jgi:hypothetical protein
MLLDHGEEPPWQWRDNRCDIFPAMIERTTETMRTEPADQSAACQSGPCH